MLERRRWILGLVAGLALVVLAASSVRREPLAIATFNLRNFPEHTWQSPGVFAAIAELDVSVVAVQEVVDAAAFEVDAARYLGPQWRVVFDDPEGSRIRLGLLYDDEVWDSIEKTSHAIGGRPALEVRLRSRDDDRHLRVFVVHLKAGGDEGDIAQRREQLRALTPIVRAPRGSDDELAVLGDFNATSQADREQLARFAHETKLDWASESLACTAYWMPKGQCLGSALDHAFTARPARSIAARGPCETHGCSPGDRCPAFHEWVSDHCPVRVEF